MVHTLKHNYTAYIYKMNTAINHHYCYLVIASKVGGTLSSGHTTLKDPKHTDSL